MRRSTLSMALMAAALLLLLVAMHMKRIEEEDRRFLAEEEAKRGEDYQERSEEETRRIFMEWKAQHGKTCNSAAEEEDEYAMFKYSLHRIDQMWYDAGYPAWSWDRERSWEEKRRVFVYWKARHGKDYSSIFHQERRYSIFKDGLRRVDRHNAEYAMGVRGSMGAINKFTDHTHEEFLAVCCGYIPEDSQPSPDELRRVGAIQERLWRVYAPSTQYV